MDTALLYWWILPVLSHLRVELGTRKHEIPVVNIYRDYIQAWQKEITTTNTNNKNSRIWQEGNRLGFPVGPRATTVPSTRAPASTLGQCCCLCTAASCLGLPSLAPWMSRKGSVEGKEGVPVALISPKLLAGLLQIVRKST